MKVLAIETSCDETAVSVAQGDEKNISVLSSVVSSQIDIHAKWGGVVPNLAAREHLKNITPVLNEALEKSGTKPEEIDLFAVTQGPGLIPALLIGTNVAKTLSHFYKKPLLGIHHIEGHIYANFQDLSSLKFPLLALVVSGGHTQLMLMQDNFEYEIIGQTQDDAVGEAFDKVAKMLDLGYPGGPIVSKLAAEFEKEKESIKNKDLKKELEEISFPRPMLKSPDLNFSFSGLKTSVLYLVKDLQKRNLNEKTFDLYKKAICFAFQEAAIEVLAKKTKRAAKKYYPKSLVIAGGVAANKKLLETVSSEMSKLPDLKIYSPKLEYCGDNAAMIAIAALFRYQKTKNKKELSHNWKTLEANANMKLQNITK